MRPLANLADYIGMGSPEWSSDGKEIALDAWRDGEALFAIDSDSDEPPHAIPGQPEDRTNSDPAWSPDGKYLVFASLE